MFTKDNRLGLDFPGHIATIVVVVMGFFVTWALQFYTLSEGGRPPFTTTTLLVATVLGAFYLGLLVLEHRALAPVFGRHAKWAVFPLLIALWLTIQLMLAGSFIIWLISMPLVGTAATELSPRPRWLVYFFVVLGFFLPLYRVYGEWQSAALTTLSFTPAIVFVVIFVRVADKAEKAQQRAESLAEQLADANHRLGDYAVQAEELATTQERNRLAREIHDNLGHYLTVANVQIQAAQALLEKDPARAAVALEKAAGLTQEGLAAVRQSVSSLRESPFGRQTLAEAIAHLADEMQATGIVTEFQQEGAPRPLNPRAELTLYRAAQEGLTNTRKHARASRVDLTLSYLDPAAVSLVVRDNGIGADSAAGAAGFGLLGLQERARQLGGRVEVTTDPGQGFRLAVELPHEPAAESAEEKS